MRQDRRPYWLKKLYLGYRAAYTRHFIKPKFDSMGEHPTFMNPRYIHIGGPNVTIGRCATVVGEVDAWVRIGVWGREPDTGRLSIGDNVLISPGTRISACDEIIIGDGVMMANGVYITDSDWHGIYDRTERSEDITPVHIADNVWLGDRCTVLKGVTIGKNSIVAAGAVVTKNIPDNVVVAGNPAKIVKQLDPDIGFKTRNEFFADPEGLNQFYDAVDRMVLTENGFFNYIRARLFPSTKD